MGVERTPESEPDVEKFRTGALGEVEIPLAIVIGGTIRTDKEEDMC